MSSSTNHNQLKGWVQHIADLTTPDSIYWCDGSASELDQMMALLIDAGAAEKLNEQKRPNSYLVRSDVGDVARVEDFTFICSENEVDAGPTNNWMDPEAMRSKLKGLFTG